MSTPATPATPTGVTAVVDTVLNDLFEVGTIAASLFVKNPNSQQKAGTFITAIGQVLALIESQL